MYGSKMFRVAKALTPLDPTQQEQRVALGKLDRVAIGKLDRVHKAGAPLDPIQ
jgi:hypothetical protein